MNFLIREDVMLSVNNVTKKYGKVIANENISLQIADGQIAVLLGPNGAGKSTIIKSIIGFLKYQGSVTVDGLLNKSIEAKRIMGYIPEIPSLYPNLTVDEHMEFVARAYKLDNYKEYKEELLRRFELDDKKKKFGDELSKGMQQKLKSMLLELKQQGASILVSTHMIDSIEELWDTTYIMMKGRVAAVVERDKIAQGDKSLEDIFFEITEGGAE